MAILQNFSVPAGDTVPVTIHDHRSDRDLAAWRGRGVGGVDEPAWRAGPGSSARHIEIVGPKPWRDHYRAVA